MGKNWAQIFDEGFASPASAVTQRVWREVYGSEYPDGVEPYSHVTRSELARFCVDLAIDDKAHLVDIGCGRGGPGLWVAAHTGARLTGVDIAASALKASEERARSLGLANRSRYLLGSFDALPLESSSVDAVMSVDALLFAPVKRAAVVEIARVLRQQGRLVFTSWDYHSQPVGRPPQIDDHRPLLQAAGFDVKAYDETDDWLGRQSRTAAGLLAAAEELASESGSSVAAVRKGLQEMIGTFDAMLRRVFAVAEKR